MTQEWVDRISHAATLEHLGYVMANAHWHGASNQAVFDAYRARRDELGTEDCIRADERLRVLREVRNAVAREALTADPYADGFGLMRAREYLTWLLAEQRRTMGLEPPKV